MNVDISQSAQILNPDQHRIIASLDFIGKLAAREKNAPNELMDLAAAWTKRATRFIKDAHI